MAAQETTQSTDDASLSALLRAAVAAVISLCTQHGIGPELPTREYAVRWMEWVDETRSLNREETRREGSFGALPPELMEQIWQSPLVDALITSAAAYVSTNGKFLPGLGFMTTEGTGRALLVEYFARVGSLRLDETAIVDACAAFASDLASDTADVETVFQVDNFSAEAPFQLGPSITFRPITAQDTDRFGRISDFPGWFLQHRDLSSKDWMCEIKRAGTKENTEEFNRHSDLVERIAGALNLTVPGRAIFFLVTNRFTSPYFGCAIVSGGTFTATSRTGGPIRLTSKEITQFQWTYQKLCDIEENSKLSFLRLPVRRLRLASTKQESEDQFVDYVIGLERLLASDTPQLETTFRFRLRGAALLPPRFGNAQERMSLMSKLYAMRSSIVHGSAAIAEITELLPKAEDVLRAIIQWYLKNIDGNISPQGIIPKLDAALVDAGATWEQEPDESGSADRHDAR